MSAGVVVVGAGPAGLSAAAELRRLGAGPVLVADREPEPGGVPRHSWHTGYGLRDLRRVMTGPAYARALVSAAVGGGRGAADGHHGDRLDDRAGRHARGHADQPGAASRRWRRRRCCSPPGAGSGRGRRGWSPATARPG